MTDKSIIDIYRNIYRHNKKKAFSYEFSNSRYIKEYRKNHDRLSKRSFTESSLKTLLCSIENSRVSFLGDFHTFSENSKNLERLLRTIAKDHHFSLGVEFIDHQYQNQIEAYLSGKIGEKKFLQVINYQRAWMFPWNQYQKFFEIAKKHHLKIVALNSKGNLTQRDKKAAKIIVDFLRSNPKSKMIALFGEYHIAPNKLPKEVAKESNSLLSQTIIHQNLDSVFWKLQHNHLNEQVIQFNANEFSLQTSPPWIKYESMIYWYENFSSFSELTINQQIENYSRPPLSENENETFIYLCKKIIDALDFKVSEEDLFDFNLYGYTRIEYILNKISKISPTALKHFLIFQIKTGKIFKLPGSNTYYCSNYSINRLAFLAGTHIHHILLNYRNINPQNLICSKNQTERLLFFLYQALISYFSAKVINPYLKCDRYQDLIKKHHSIDRTNSKKRTLKLALDIINRQDSLNNLVKGSSLRQLHASGKIVGNLLGEVLYEDYFKKGKKSFSSLKILIMNNQHRVDEFNDLIDILLPHNEYKNQKKRFL